MAHAYAQALLIQAQRHGRGSVKDLQAIVDAIEELMALKAMELNLAEEQLWAA